jgi:hypothetical protein
LEGTGSGIKYKFQIGYRVRVEPQVDRVQVGNNVQIGIIRVQLAKRVQIRNTFYTGSL